MARRATSWGGLTLLSLGLGLDNVVIGFSLGLSGTDPLTVAATIAAFSTAFSWIGIGIGSAARRHWEQRAEGFAGVLLVGLAVASWMGWLG